MATTPTATVRLITAATAGAAAAALAAYPVAAAPGSSALPLTLGLLALAALVAGLATRRAAATGAGLALLALELAFQPGHSRHLSFAATAAFAGGLVLVAELAFWSHNAGWVTPTRQRILRRAATTLIAALAATAIGALVVAGGRASASGLLARTARHRRRDRSHAVARPARIHHTRARLTDTQTVKLQRGQLNILPAFLAVLLGATVANRRSRPFKNCFARLRQC